MWFFDIRKYLTSLFGDVEPRDIGLGLGLGVLAGLPPLGPFIALVVLFFLVVRANLTLFLIGFALAKALAVAMAPVLDAVGRTVLEAGPLKGFWAWLLNQPGVCLLGWDRYLTLGATVVGAVGGVVLAGLAVVLLPPFRRWFWSMTTRGDRMKRLTGSKYGRLFVRLVFGHRLDTEDVAARKGVVRKGFVIPALAFVVAVVVFLELFGDTLARKGGELAASQALGKNVKIDQAALALFGGSLDLTGLFVKEPNPGQKKAEIAQGQRVVLDFSPMQLLARRLVVDQLAAENLVYHADTENMPAMPPEPAQGQSIGLGEIVTFVKAHEEQIRWLLDQVGGALEKSDQPPAKNAPGFEGRAAYVAAAQHRPAFLARKAGVTNLVFDWGDARGPLTRLKRLDLNLHDLSSNPVRHSAPIVFDGGGTFGQGKLEVKGVLDVRTDSHDGHKLDVGLDLGSFGQESRLGLGGGRDLKLTLSAGFDRTTRALSTATCLGSFKTQDNAAGVNFALTLAGQPRFQVQLKGFDVTRFAAYQRPDALGVDQGVVDLNADLNLTDGKLAGTVALQATKLLLRPGQAKTLAGIPTDQLCRGLNSLTQTQPLGLTLQLGGTPENPTVTLDDKGLGELLEQVKAGLVAAGQQALTGEIDRRLNELTGKLGGKLGDKLGGKLGQDLGKEIGKKVGIDPKDVQKAVGDKVGKEVGGLLEGLLGGKKKKEDPKEKEKEKEKK